MTSTSDQNDETQAPDPLEAYFEAARAEVPRLNDGHKDALMARILADAGQVQADFAASERNRHAAPRAPRRSLSAVILGGWRGAGGLLACACVGLWIGLIAPEAVLAYGDPLGFATEAEPLSGEALLGADWTNATLDDAL